MDSLNNISDKKTKIKTAGVNLFYGDFQALSNINMDIKECAITAIIGPSGCGKSSLLRLFNRMNDPIPGVKVEEKFLDGISLYEDMVLALKVGMVFKT